ncbi:ammememosam b: ammememoradisam system protein b [Lucifera butyrica]|uniref:Ammememosam b: ammememoradisam system protein b n=1 Tax=Lucifera butyrica TaxID=1351585 RepID=A0A498R140_9FIRM|nr:AmmeMemoRadiSam system protein B [Lucifera butyrica]VBB04875.1 ammememosam b: ammememoradisam system protein b [Lucifera butyrica]
MNNLVGCALMPHPPIMIPEVGKDELATISATVTAMDQAAHALKEYNPQTVVIMSPHGPVFKDAVSISIHPRLKGNFSAFGAPDVSLGFEADSLIVRHILKKAERLGINLVELTEDVAKNYRLSLQLDHGAMVPLYYLHKAGFKGQLVHLSVGMLAYEEMYTLGKAVQTAVHMVDKKVAVIASGDLSHRLTPDAPAGYSPRGQEFDRQVLDALGKLDVKQLLAMDHSLIEEAGECGLRPIFFLMGVLGGLEVTPKILSYEGPFGVGYAVGLFSVKTGKGGAGANGR